MPLVITVLVVKGRFPNSPWPCFCGERHDIMLPDTTGEEKEVEKQSGEACKEDASVSAWYG
jgi:hypothetical protein